MALPSRRNSGFETTRVYLVGLTPVGIDEPQFTSIGYQNLVATPLEHPANPGRMGSRLDGYAQRPLTGKAPPEGFWGGAQPTLLDHLAALLVDEAQVGVFVSEVQSGCHLWSLAVSIHGGPILLPNIGPLEPVNICRPSDRVLRGGSAFSSHLLRTSKGEVRKCRIGPVRRD